MRNLRWAGVSFVVLAAMSLSGLAQTSPLEQTLIDSQRAVANAEVKKDAALINRTLAEGFTEVDPNGGITDREDFVKGVPDSDVTNILLYEFKLVPLNEGAAVLTYDRVILRSKMDFGSRRYQHMSSVWVMQGGAWKLKFQQATPNQWSANDFD